MPSQLPTHCGNYELKPRVSEKYAKDPEIGTVFGRLTTVSEVIAERYPSGRAVKKSVSSLLVWTLLSMQGLLMSKPLNT